MRRRSWILGAATAAAGLAGCASPAPKPTLLAFNPRLSEGLKARSFRSYREVLLVPPRTDPRGIGARLKTEVEALGFQARLVDPARPLDAPQGTAFVIGAEGWLLTCAHVLGEEQVATLSLNGSRLLADVVHADRKADLALLRLRQALPAGTTVLGFRTAERVAVMGEDVVTIGYPLSRLLGNSARMSRGQLSATAGLRDDPRELQVSAPIHPGNSGGPLLDRDGQVIGVVHKVINPTSVQAATGGALPQNINFAIKAQPVLDFLRGAEPRVFAELAYDRPASIDAAARAIARIQAGIVAPDAERREKLELRVVPVVRHVAGTATTAGIALAGVDHETKEILFQVVAPVAAPSALDDPTLDAMMDRLRSALRSR